MGERRLQRQNLLPEPAIARDPMPCMGASYIGSNLLMRAALKTPKSVHAQASRCFEGSSCASHEQG